MNSSADASTPPAALAAGGGSQGGSRTERLIVHVIDGLRVGGAQTHLVTMLRQAMTAYPHIKHRAISLFNDGPIGDQLRDLGVPVDVLDVGPYFAKRRFLGASRVLADLLRDHRPDLVEAHLTWSRLLGLYAAWRAGVTCRLAFEHGELYLSSWKFRLAHGLAQVFADRIIVVSGALADWARTTYRLSPSRRAILHNCVDLERFGPSAVVGSGPPIDRPAAATVFVSVGTLGRGVNKRMDVCIRAIHAARTEGVDVGLVICGDGEQRVELEELARSLGVADSIAFLGMRSDVPRVLAACDAFCLATAFDPCPIAGIEAMAASLPVVTPTTGGLAEIVEDRVTGILYPALDHEALAVAMRHLHEDPSRRRTMGIAARRVVEKHYSVQRYIERLYGLYDLDRTRGGAA
jgi:L-malate glycosyltransferase